MMGDDSVKLLLRKSTLSNFGVDLQLAALARQGVDGDLGAGRATSEIVKMGAP